MVYGCFQRYFEFESIFRLLFFQCLHYWDVLFWQFFRAPHRDSVKKSKQTFSRELKARRFMRKECLLNSHDTKQNIEAHNEQYNIDKAWMFSDSVNKSFQATISSKVLWIFDFFRKLHCDHELITERREKWGEVFSTSKI